MAAFAATVSVPVIPIVDAPDIVVPLKVTLSMVVFPEDRIVSEDAPTWSIIAAALLRVSAVAPLLIRVPLAPIVEIPEIAAPSNVTPSTTVFPAERIVRDVAPLWSIIAALLVRLRTVAALELSVPLIPTVETPDIAAPVKETDTTVSGPFVEEITREPDSAQSVIVEVVTSKSMLATFDTAAPATSTVSMATNPLDRIFNEVAPVWSITAVALVSSSGVAALAVRVPLKPKDETPETPEPENVIDSIVTAPFVEEMAREPDAAECVIVDDVASKFIEATFETSAPATWTDSMAT